MSQLARRRAARAATSGIPVSVQISSSAPVGTGASGQVVAIEVKAAETVRREDFRGIQALQRRIGDQLAGYVLYAGSRVLPFGDRLRAAPISVLWR